MTDIGFGSCSTEPLRCYFMLSLNARFDRQNQSRDRRSTNERLAEKQVTLR